MRIYVAHNYGRRRGLSPSQCEYNAWRSIVIGRELIKRGHNPFIPNLYHFVHSGWDETLEEDEWHELVNEWLPFCDAILVASKPCGENSGVQKEIDAAKALGKRIYYSIEEIK